MSRYEALREHFARTGMEVEEHAADGWVATDGFGANGAWLLVGQAYDDRGAVAVYSVLGAHVPEERRDAMDELLTRLNHGIVLGSFEMDYEDGEVRFKCSAPAPDAPTPESLGPLTAVALSVTDHYLPALQAVLDDGDPAAVAEHYRAQ
ncbi:MAG TPA: YbjN domain-containing protein [Solirubrobacteraceae bacterium]|nr:YbjN domain-containing protein [Solirubrobacteraceae bacterium]